MIDRVAQAHTFIPRSAAVKLGIPVDRIPGDEVVLIRVLNRRTGERSTIAGPGYWMMSWLAMRESALALLDDPDVDPESLVQLLDEPELDQICQFEVAGYPEDWKTYPEIVPVD